MVGLSANEMAVVRLRSFEIALRAYGGSQVTFDKARRYAELVERWVLDGAIGPAKPEPFDRCPETLPYDGGGGPRCQTAAGHEGAHRNDDALVGW